MSDRFTESVEKLLNREVICQYSHEGLYRYLRETHHFEDVNQYLSRIQRTLLTTRDQLGYYCGYLNPNEENGNIRRQFELITDKLEGLIAWLRMARMAENSDRPVIAGDFVKEADLLNALEESPILLKQLSDVAHKLGVGKRDSSAKVKLSKVLSYLNENGYLNSVTGAGSVYRATAKWTLLYEQLEFIVQFEELSTEEQDQPTQGDLF